MGSLVIRMKLATLGFICVFGVGYSAPQRKFNQQAVQFAKKNNPLDKANTQLVKDVSQAEYQEALDRINGLFQKGLTAGLRALDAEDLAGKVIKTYGGKVADAVNNAGQGALDFGTQKINDATKNYKKQINEHLKNGQYGFAVQALQKPADQLRKLAEKKAQDKFVKPKNLGNKKILDESKRRGIKKYNDDYKPAVNDKVGEQLNKIQARNN